MAVVKPDCAYRSESFHGRRPPGPQSRSRSSPAILGESEAEPEDGESERKQELLTGSPSFVLDGVRLTPWQADKEHPIQFDPDYIVAAPEPTHPRTLGYGFGDGPNCSHNAFYDHLTSQNQKASECFFSGHGSASTWSHRALTTLTNEQVSASSADMLAPPRRAISTTAYDANDWRAPDGSAAPDQVQANYDYLIANVSAGTFDTIGAIMPAHELYNYTMQTAIDNYPKLAAFDHIVPVGVLYHKTQLYVETNYTQPNFEQCESFFCFVPIRALVGHMPGSTSPSFIRLIGPTSGTARYQAEI
ncbi:hypothetical protein C8R45DRAFT_1134394 [Mycena sanguinolenta]|nr:hypothetical protein C8R45DRAFT_1134394 [Mycena sanguinolenta]